ncbi:MAG: NADP-dependent malic enzyme [Candidatus Diapherotrites archaeon]|nr:NADP-dependent malic enzyme [Candidatus Diapherotrites archaeon]
MPSDIFAESLALHKKLRGKLSVQSKVPVKSRHDLSVVYTPGMAEACRQIALDKKAIFDLTWKGNSVAVLSDGSAVLGLGDIGPEAALPVMEGKAVLFKEFANIDAVPIVVNASSAKEIADVAVAIAPTFGGINLEDIAAPECFEAEREIKRRVSIPVMHDDQHGTAIVVYAALLNAAKVAGKRVEDLKIVVNGAGAAGTAIARWLHCTGMDDNVCVPVREIILVDSVGAIHNGRAGLNGAKRELAKLTNPNNAEGRLAEVVVGADVFIGVSRAGLMTPAMIRSMNEKPIVFAMANPVPEIMPDEALKAGAFIVGTGRSDFPNQINNVLAFPGVFRGALDAKATEINEQMKMAASKALAKAAGKPSRENILPNAVDKGVVPKIAKAVARAARESGVTR